MTASVHVLRPQRPPQGKASNLKPAGLTPEAEASFAALIAALPTKTEPNR